jgi:hypothetical protein
LDRFEKCILVGPIEIDNLYCRVAKSPCRNQAMPAVDDGIASTAGDYGRPVAVEGHERGYVFSFGRPEAQNECWIAKFVSRDSHWQSINLADSLWLLSAYSEVIVSTNKG